MGKIINWGKAWRIIIIAIFISTAYLGLSFAEGKPVRGGILVYTVGGTPPSYDGHKEDTVGMLHVCRPHYNLLVKIDPDNYPNVVGDLAESWEISKDGMTFRFKIRKGVRFHDGSTMTSKDIKASYDHIIFPPKGVISFRKALYSSVERVDAPDEYTVIFKLKYPTAGFLNFLASPYNFIYKADILAENPFWYEKNVMGTGPFKFVEHVAGSHWVGKRNDDYFVKDRPYLDGFRALFIDSDNARLSALRSGNAHIDFRFFNPTNRDDMVRAMGDKIVVQESTWISSMFVVINCSKKPFDDLRVRKALTLALDRWGGLAALSKITRAKYVGGLLTPGSELSMTEEELTKLAGFSKNIEASRKEARRLLREAGIPEGFSFTIRTRNIEEWETQGTWLIDQWRQIGLNVAQITQDMSANYVAFRTGNFDLGLFGLSDFMDDPSVQFIQFISKDKAPSSYGHYIDRTLDELYLKQSQTIDQTERRKLCLQFQKRVLDEMVYQFPIHWNGRITLQRAEVKGWKALPSHTLNVSLENIWLDKSN